MTADNPASVTPRPMTEEQRRCTHYADMWGRCIDCGATWAQRGAAQSTPTPEGGDRG